MSYQDTLDKFKKFPVRITKLAGNPDDERYIQGSAANGFWIEGLARIPETDYCTYINGITNSIDFSTVPKPRDWFLVGKAERVCHMEWGILIFTRDSLWKWELL
jgi:hypothetical protein